jgi:hypothetical protein
MKAIALGVVVLVSFAGYAAASPGGSSAAKPYGIWKVSLNAVDPHVPSGLWTLELRPGRYWLGCRPGCNPVLDSGRLKVEGGVLTFGRQTLCPAVGRYRWRIGGGTLRLTLIGKDSCSGNDRTVVLTSKPWTKRP